MGDSVTNATYVGAFHHPHDGSAVANQMAEDPAAIAYMLDDNQRALEHFLANQHIVTVTGVSDGTGAVDLEHGIDMTNRSVLLAQAWYEGTLGRAVPAVVADVDATVITVTGAGATDPVRATIVLSRLLNF